VSDRRRGGRPVRDPGRAIGAAKADRVRRAE
jgi:hypothetical protein